MGFLRIRFPGLVAAAAVLLGAQAFAAEKGKPGVADGQRVYAKECARCHGASGKGDGDDAMYYTTKPTDFTSREPTSTRTDEFLATVITKGGPAKGLSTDMPAFQLSKADVQSVIAYLRQLSAAPKGK
jgi:mono/diheme cytochrome c family protein